MKGILEDKKSNHFIVKTVTQSAPGSFPVCCDLKRTKCRKGKPMSFRNHRKQDDRPTSLSFLKTFPLPVKGVQLFRIRTSRQTSRQLLNLAYIGSVIVRTCGVRGHDIPNSRNLLNGRSFAGIGNQQSIPSCRFGRGWHNTSTKESLRHCSITHTSGTTEIYCCKSLLLQIRTMNQKRQFQHQILSDMN